VALGIEESPLGQLGAAYGLDVNPLFYRRAVANVYDPERYIAGLQVLAWVVVLGIVFLGGYFLHDLLADAQNFVVFLGVELPVLVLVLVIPGRQFYCT